MFRWVFKRRFILAEYEFDLVGIKKSWHSTEGGSIIVDIGRVSVTNRYPACTLRKWCGLEVGKEKCNLKEDKKVLECVMMRKETVDLSIRS